MTYGIKDNRPKFVYIWKERPNTSGRSVFERMAAAKRVANDPQLIEMIGEERDRGALLRIRLRAIRENAHRLWIALISRRIADLTRITAPSDFAGLLEKWEVRYEARR